MILAWVLALPLLVSAQIQIGKTGTEIKSYWKKQQKTGARYSIEAGPNLSILVTESRDKGAVHHTYEADSLGRCAVQRVESDNQEYTGNFLSQLLAIPRYQWKKLNENQYISRYEDFLLIELPADGSMKYVKLLHMEWNRTLYDLLSNTN